MLVNKKYYITIWQDSKSPCVIKVINQNLLPFRFEILSFKKSDEIIRAIKNMAIRGAPLIGIAAAYCLYLAAIEGQTLHKNNFTKFKRYIFNKADVLKKSRPTAINLSYVIDLVFRSIKLNVFSSQLPFKSREKSCVDNFLIEKCIHVLSKEANRLALENIHECKKIGEYGYKVFKEIYIKKKLKCLNILTHCNAGWLACIDYGTATSPIYEAYKKGINLHVWVEETRPRNQGSLLTAWELKQMNIPHTVITDNAGGYVMCKGLVDVVIVGSDRTTLRGDVINKVGTYKTALAASDNKIPFFVALPTSSFDPSLDIKNVPIEERSGNEVKYAYGLHNKNFSKVMISNPGSRVINYSFDITPARLVSGLITNKGIIKPNIKSIKKILAIA